MCSICGGTRCTEDEFRLFKRARDRGRDYSNVFYRNDSWICNHRAIPTTEVKNPEYNQPFGTDYKIVHNGTISNDKELGNPPGAIDSAILPKVLNCETIDTLTESLKKIKGSYAIAIMKPNGHFYLACNYKPLFYVWVPKTRGFGYDIVFSSYAEHLSGYENIKRVKPYSVFDTEFNEYREIERHQSNKAIVICSGGLDSTAVAAYVCHEHGAENTTLIHYCYGCIAESKETECIKKIAEYLKCNLKFIKIDMSFMNGNSALFKTENDIHKGIEGSEYAYEWVPARNLIMMSLAVGYAEANDFGHIYLGTNLEEGGCLSGDTVVKIRKNQNYKEITLSELYEKWISDKDNFFNTVADGGVVSIRTMMPNGVFKYTPIDNVYCTGKKEILKITLENGYVIKSSKEHEFYTSNGYVQSDKLRVGDEIWCNGKRKNEMTDEQYQEWIRKLSIAKIGDRNPNKKRENADKIRVTCNLKFATERSNDKGYVYVGGMGFHPYCTSFDHVYKHRLVVEANMNNMSYDDWVLKIRKNEFNGSEIFLDPDYDVHHKDGNKNNNDLSNLEILSKQEHAKLHITEDPDKSYPKLDTCASLEKIISIENIGMETTYDISVRGTHNYVANGIVGHNSYPDNDNQFIKDFDSCLWGAVQNGVKVQVHTPVGNLMKHEIVAFGNQYNAPFHLTWSCYKKGENPCGECGPCFMRRTAFRRNGLEDPLQYPKMIGFDEVEKESKNIVQNIDDNSIKGMN